MAIYRTGQASMDAQGYITGYDTKWREQLALIRPGATIFFIDAPFQAAVISEVISDTQIRAITTGGAEIGRSNYIILLHDSITVDGLAQDVAETLRYYQSKETQIEEAIEFFKNLDLKQLQDLANQVKGDAEKTANDRAATEQLKNNTQQIKDSAVAETNQIKADTDAIKEQTQQIKDSAVTETEAIKQEAFGARDQAELARDSAGNHAVDANNAKAGAETARDEARQWVQQVQPENLLHKDQNLNDLANKDLAREALKVEAVNSVKDQATGAYNSFRNPAWTYELRIANNGEWRVARNDNNSTSALSVGAGGTGADNVAQARRNLGVGIDQDVTFNAVCAKAYYGQGGPLTAAVIKDKSQQSSDGTNVLSYIENSWFGIQNYVAGAPGQQYQYVWSFNTFGGDVVWYSMRNDNGFYTPEGRCAIQGSDVRIKDRFEPPKPGAWDRVKQIGVMEFYYKGNHVLQRGYLAQQMAEIDDTYVFFGGTATDENGDEFEIMNVNDRAVISDLITVVQQLQKDNEEMKSEIADLKAAVSALLNKPTTLES